jgi:hypothetical protein
MKRTVIRGERQPPSRDLEDRWTRLVHDDVAGIDGDIERLVGLLREQHGYTRAGASAELLRRLRGVTTFGDEPGVSVSS